MLEHLDPDQELLPRRFFRDHCHTTLSGEHIKDLRIFRNVGLADLAIVDNSALAYCYHKENGIPIVPFIDNCFDN